MGLIQTATQNSDGSIAISIEGKPTYRYCMTNCGNPGAEDWLQIQGSATRTVKVRSLRVIGVSTGGGSWPVGLTRRSTAASGGTPTVVTGIPHDPQSPAATAVVTYLEAGPTAGTFAGFLGLERAFFPASGAPVRSYGWEFGLRMEKPIILRGAADFLCCYNWGVSPPAGISWDWELELEEDNS